MDLKLGRRFPLRSKFHLHNYLGSNLPPVPSSCDWTKAMSQPWGMMGNDQLGDCTCAMAGHAVQVITSNGDRLIQPSDQQVIQLYEGSGYDPSDPSTDQGWTLDAVLTAVQQNGLAGVKIDAFADTDISIAAAQQAIYLFGGANLGVMITQADMDAFKNGEPWTSTSMDSVLGGHAIFAPQYYQHGIGVITWGKLQAATWDWFLAHCDEVKAAILFPWVQNTLGKNPDGFNQAQLEADLKAEAA